MSADPSTPKVELGIRDKRMHFCLVTIPAGSKTTLTRSLQSPFLAQSLFLGNDVAGKLVVHDLTADRWTLFLDDVDPEGNGGDAMRLPGTGEPPFPGTLFTNVPARILFDQGRRPAFEFVLRLQNVSGYDLVVEPVLVGREFLTKPRFVDPEHFRFYVQGGDPTTRDDEREHYRLNDVLGRISGKPRNFTLQVFATTREGEDDGYHRVVDSGVSEHETLGDARDALHARMMHVAARARL